MVTIEQFKEFLLNQDLFEREVDEIIKNLNIERLIENENFDLNDYKISIIKNAYDFGRDYLEEHTSDSNILNFIDYAEFGRYIAEEDDLCYYCESSDRVIIWEDL
jgi:hypothetical protein